MNEARQALLNARAVHESAAAVLDADANADGDLALQRAGRAYAAAVTAFSNATMAWLAFVDNELRPPKRT